MSEDCTGLIKALIKARPEFGEIKKTKTNPFHKSKYAPLDNVLSAAQPALSKNGLTIVQVTEVREERLVLVTRLMHEEGGVIESVYPLPATQEPQDLGKAITYGRRYSVCALLSVTADEDDDGNLSRRNAPKKTNGNGNAQRVKEAREATGLASEEVVTLIRSIDPEKDHPNQLTKPECDQLIRMIEAAAMEATG